jgi:hypothetical protein
MRMLACYEEILEDKIFDLPEFSAWFLQVIFSDTVTHAYVQSINIKHAKTCILMYALEIKNTTQVNNGQLTQA